MKEQIKGGLADGKPDSAYPPAQLKKGIKVEMEHTDDPKKAKEIAKDHLAESETYYTHLEKMETKMEKESSAFFRGFEKRAYNYEWEAREQEQYANRRQHEQPTRLGKALGVGGLLGATLGAGAGLGLAMTPNRYAAGAGALVGGALGMLGGAGVRSAQKADIKDSKYVMRLDPEVRKQLLTSRAWEDDLGRQQAAQAAAMHNAAMMHAMMTNR